MCEITCLDSKEADFAQRFAALLDRQQGMDTAVEQTVAEILAAVRERGDAALLDYTQRFDRLAVSSAADLQLSSARIQQAVAQLDAAQTQALRTAAARIRRYAEHQVIDDWSFEDEYGNRLGQQITPIERVGMYVPGGKAAYPSSVLMNAIPAKVAGVRQLIMVVPTPDGEINLAVLAAAAIAEVDAVFTVGGAQAVAALAYGSTCIPQVDKIVGPGNRYVAAAKRQVFGAVGIDMLAGPSEIVVVCDGATDPDWIAMDLFSQAEHDEAAQAILISPDGEFIAAVIAAIQRLLGSMPRQKIIQTALQQHSACIQVRDLAEAIALVNRIAPEHLELSVADPKYWASQVKHAGAMFFGRYTAEALGDYCAGPNHVLPTAGTARFTSPLGVYDFQKRSSIIDCTATGAAALGRTASVLAHSEGLIAHAQSAEYRIPKE